MARPRSKSGSSKTSPPAVKRKSAPATGIAGGTGVAAIAQALPEPYKKIFSIFAPALSIAIASWGPLVLDGIASIFVHISSYAKNRYAIYQIKEYLKEQKKRLDDPSLTPERRAEIEAKIRLAEASHDAHQYEWVSPYLRGDSLSGLREATGAENGATENTQPPAGDGGNG